MCGIFGVISFNRNGIDKEKVLASRDVMAHRGPDDAGIYFSQTSIRSFINIQDDSAKTVFVALAHRRLSIIDLSPAAHQPMVSEDASPPARQGRYVIVFNGEIYNFSQIKNEKLKIKNFKTDSDTEVILNLYAQYRKDCLKFLRGMFAFAVWDDKEKKLFAARDRFGIKPFYFYDDGSEFIFSSELKAIKHYKGNLTINNDALDAFLRTGSVPAPMTIYKEVKALMPGNYLELFVKPSQFDAAQCDILKVTINKYWRFGDLFGKSAAESRQLASEDNVISTNEESSRSATKGNLGDKISQSPDKSGSFEMTSSQHQVSSTGYRFCKLKYDDEAKIIIREALLDTIRAHMVADVEVGAFLSGGIDSTAIVSLMRQVGKEKIKTVSIVFPDSRFDESKYSRLAAKKYNTEHIEFPFYEKDLLDDFENIMAVMDQPTIDGINTYFVSKAAKLAGMKVVLSGLGGDELFGGYPSFNLIPKLWKIKKIPFAKMFMKFAAPLLKNKLPAKAIEYLRNPDVENAEYRLVRGLFTDEELSKLGWRTVESVISSDLPDGKVGARNRKDFSVEDAFEMTKMQHISYLESCYYMRNQLLRDSDVFSMAHSIELRVPFVDHLLYAAVLPYLDHAYDKNFSKKMLVEAVGDIPDEIIHRPKMGFTFPFEDWIMKGQLKDLIHKSNINFSKLKIDKVHWSRKWALFILSKFVI